MRDKTTTRAFVRNLLAAFAALPVLLLPVMARGDAASYASQRRRIRACIVYSGTDQNAILDNYAPYVFYVMDRRTDIKPGGWEFYNPLAPGTITPSIRARMLYRGGNNDPTLNTTQTQINAPLTKNLAAYWEVNLDTVTAEELGQFDIVLMPLRYRTSLFITPDESAKLSRFVDGGGTLWLEDENGLQSLTIPLPGFLFPVKFRSQSAIGRTRLGQPHHPLVNYPFPISNAESRELGFNGASFYHYDPTNQNNNATPPSPRYMAPVIISNQGLPYISAGEFGGGHVVVSSAGVATGISAFAGGVALPIYGANNGAVSGENILGARPTDLKFAYNLAAWTSSVPTGAASPRRTGATGDDIPSDPGKKFSTIPAVPGDAGNPGSGAAIFKGVIFFVDNNNVLHAYDANPATDLDNDKNPDDGILDYSRGAPYDEIWNYDLKSVSNVGQSAWFATPTLITFYDTTLNRTRDGVVVTSSDGVTVAFDAFSVNNNGRLKPVPDLLWSQAVRGKTASNNNDDLKNVLVNPTQNNLPMPGPSPAFSEGIVFTLVEDPATTSANTPWRVAALDPRTGLSIFDQSAFTGSGNSTVAPAANTMYPQILGMPSISGPLTVGYVRDAGSGAVDKIIFAPNAVQISPKAPGGLTGLWFSTRGEPMVLDTSNNQNNRYVPNGARAHVPWFVDDSGPVGLKPVLHLVTRNLITAQITNSQDFVWSAGLPNNFTISYSPASGMAVTLGSGIPVVPANSVYEVRMDYTVDWPGRDIPAGSGTFPALPDMQVFSRNRSQFTMIDPNNGTGTAMPFLTGSPALSSDGLAIFGASGFQGTGSGNPALGDRTIAFRDRVSTNQQIPNSEVAWMWAPTDGNNSAAIGGATTPPRLINTDPVAGRDSSGTYSGPAPILQFHAVGSPAVANGVVYVVGTAIMQVAPNGSGPPVTVVLALRANPTMTFSSGVRIPASSKVTLRQDNFASPNAVPPTVELSTEKLDVDTNTGTIHIKESHLTNNDLFNIALPITIVVDGQPVQPPVVNSVTGAGPLDNLIWFMVIPNNIYPAAGETLPSYITTKLHVNYPTSGPSVIGNTLYFGAYANSTSGAFNGVVSVDLVGGNGQVNIFPDKPSNSSPRVHISDPVRDSITSGVIGNSPIINPPLGTANMVAVGFKERLMGLENLVTVITDTTRVLEIDHAGNAVWDLTGTRSFKTAGGELPIYNGGNVPVNQQFATGQLAAARVALSRPTVARRANLNDFIIADTGNNRIIETDKGGNIKYEVHTLNNDMKFLRPGDPITLNAPTDVQSFTDSGVGISITNTSLTDPANPNGYTFTYNGPFTAQHHVIADSGNFRAVEIVDAFDRRGRVISLTGPNGEIIPMIHQIVFVTRTLSEQNARFRYRTIQEFLDPTTPNQQEYLIAAVDNIRQAGVGVPNEIGVNGTNTSGAGGSLMVITRYGADDGKTATIIDSIMLPTGNNTYRRQTIANPTWFKEFDLQNPNSGAPEPHYLLADNNGVYQLAPGQVNGSPEAVVEWMLSNDDYLYLTGRPLRAACIQRLSQADFDANANLFRPHYLITNRYTGQDNVAEVFFGQSGLNVPHGEIHGEVVEVRSDIYYSGSVLGYLGKPYRLYTSNNNGWLTRTDPSQSAIVWMAPNESIPSNPGPIKRSIGSTSNATFTALFEEPTFADRPY